MAKIYKLREGIEYLEKNPKGNYGDLYVNVDGSVINKLEKSLNWLKFNGNNYKFKIN